jgi:hypothetical protein
MALGQLGNFYNPIGEPNRYRWYFGAGKLTQYIIKNGSKLNYLAKNTVLA